MNSTAAPSFREAAAVWVRVALLSFGGPAGQIAVMHRIVVEEKRWVSESRFLQALNYCMLLPGPEAQQLATYLGWMLHRTLGGIVAGGLFILPGFLSILALSILYASFRDLALVEGIFYGLKPAVLAIVVEAVIRIGKRALDRRAKIILAAAAFVGIFFLNLPFPLIILGAGLLGYSLSHSFSPSKIPEAGDDPPQSQPRLRRTLGVAAAWTAIWLAPVAVLAAALGRGHVFTELAIFFSKVAVVTFGGAYAVLAYVAQRAVEDFGWLRPGEMLDALGMAETTPGPLMQVVQFVGFIAPFRDPGDLSPLIAGVIGSVVTTWVVFAPSFLWIFVGAPYVESLSRFRKLQSALAAITAAVVGVILNLAVWFALHTLFARGGQRDLGPFEWYQPVFGTIDPYALGIAAGAFLALLYFRLGMLATLALAVAAGVLIRLVA